MGEKSIAVGKLEWDIGRIRGGLKNQPHWFGGSGGGFLKKKHTQAALYYCPFDVAVFSVCFVLKYEP